MATAVLPRKAPQILPGRRYDNIFFSVMAGIVLVLVAVGFARTYFLAGVFRAHLPALIIHIHGAAFTSWVLLLIAQVSLVSTGRVDIHRKLGVAGFCLAALMLVLGFLAATNALTRNMKPPQFPFDAATFYAIPLGDMFIFSALIFFAYRARNNPAAHKRLILLATIALMDAPTGRPPFAAITGRPHMDSIFIWALVLLMMGYDLWALHKLHKATLWGGLFLVIAGQLRVPVGMSSAWHSFASWVLTIAH
ncbi:MAG: hypothetical protein ACM3JB_24280 [Acidobacteriaceae bacterium]